MNAMTTTIKSSVYPCLAKVYKRSARTYKSPKAYCALGESLLSHPLERVEIVLHVGPQHIEISS